MKSILILGSNGMLGSAVTNNFEGDGNFRVLTLNRQSKVGGTQFDAKNESSLIQIRSLEPDWIVNCVGVIKPHIDEKNPESVKNAFSVNSNFPRALNTIAKETNSRIIQIATDCVFSGSRGQYSEKDIHDPVEIYGVSKSQGEIESENFMNIRCSIVGPDSRSQLSLLEWFLSQEENSTITGYLDHFWNGVTTDAFARICIGIIKNDFFEPGTHHQVPADSLSKAKLLELFQAKFGRDDLRINQIITGDAIDRTLKTLNPERNRERWLAAGYSDIPKIKDLIDNLQV